MEKFQVIDLFAGAGGFGLGFELAGFDVACSLEIDQWAADTLRFNAPNRLVIQDDIRNYHTTAEIKQICPLVPDVIIGGPPCQGFSVAGPAQKDPKDPRNNLFKNFAKWVECFEPQIFVMENVKGLLSGRNADKQLVIDIVKNTFTQLGYAVTIWLLNAAEYGVPQTRERIFIVGNKLGIDEISPPPKTHTLENQKVSTPQLGFWNDAELCPAISLWEAISDLPELGAGEGEEEQPYCHSAETEYQRTLRRTQQILFNHVAMQHSSCLIERFKHIGWGESSADVPIEHLPLTRNGNSKISQQAYDQNNRRLNPNKPSHTIAASFYANFLHPYQHRNITAREGARIQSFPDSYRFMGKKTVVSHKLLGREGRFEERYLCQYNQIGNAVPPYLAKAIARQIDKVLIYTGLWGEQELICKAHIEL